MEMIIDLYPVARLENDPNLMEPLVLSKSGDTLTINKIAYDLSVIPAGATLPDAAEATGCEYFVGDIERDDEGILHMKLLLPHLDDAPESVRFPEPVHVTQDGPIAIPGADNGN